MSRSRSIKNKWNSNSNKYVLRVVNGRTSLNSMSTFAQSTKRTGSERGSCLTEVVVSRLLLMNRDEILSSHRICVFATSVHWARVNTRQRWPASRVCGCYLAGGDWNNIRLGSRHMFCYRRGSKSTRLLADLRSIKGKALDLTVYYISSKKVM